jgi:hypothetical protein
VFLTFVRESVSSFFSMFAGQYKDEATRIQYWRGLLEDHIVLCPNPERVSRKRFNIVNTNVFIARVPKMVERHCHKLS